MWGPASPAPSRESIVVPRANWWMISGVMVALGGIFIGIAFVLLGISALPQPGGIDYLAGFYGLIGVGIMFISVSWLFARMVPRTS
jgi:hypothetical protein